jgi:cation diffusion facilitator family transporter
METTTSEGVVKDSAARSKLSSRAINIALIANILLALLKTIVGVFTHSAALLADGINSASDVVYNVTIAILIRASVKPADDEHPYGHSQFESIGALVIGAFIATAAFTIFWNSVQTLVDYFQNPADFTALCGIVYHVIEDRPVFIHPRFRQENGQFDHYRPGFRPSQ